VPKAPKEDEKELTPASTVSSRENGSSGVCVAGTVVDVVDARMLGWSERDREMAKLAL
jgi:hypothetical protein